jgi:hypothetical protein
LKPLFCYPLFHIGLYKGCLEIANIMSTSFFFTEVYYYPRRWYMAKGSEIIQCTINIPLQRSSDKTILIIGCKIYEYHEPNCIIAIGGNNILIDRSCTKRRILLYLLLLCTDLQDIPSIRSLVE